MLPLLARLWRTLSQHQKRRLFVLVALLALAGVLEMIGIGVLLPVVALFQDPGKITSSAILANASTAIGSPSPERFVLMALGALFA